MFAEKRSDGSFHHVFSSKVQLIVCGVDNPIEVEVIPLLAEEDGRYFAWQEKDGELLYIYQERWLVEMCSPDGFKVVAENSPGL